MKTSLLQILADRINKKHSSTASFYTFDPIGHSKFYLSALEWVLNEIEKLNKESETNHIWININDRLPTQSDQYWVAYHPISTINPNERTKEICYCTAHFNEFTKEWSVKDQLFYTQRQCQVLFWQPILQPPKE